MSGAPHPWDVSIDGHNYMLDLGQAGAMRHESIPLLRPIYVTADRLGENDINPESNWRFSDIDWTHGAGQRHADAADSDSSRFWRSRGVDVWTKGQLSLLHVLASGTGGLGDRMFTVGGHLYVQDGSGTLGHNGLAFDGSNVVEAAAVFGAATDGTLVYYSDSTAVLKQTVGVAGAGTTFNTLTGVEQLYYESGRLIGVGSLNHIFDIRAGSDTDLGVLPGMFVPVDMTSAPNAIYVAAVNSGTGQSQVFEITIDPTGTTLNPPVAVTPPFDGTLRRILYYEGVVIFGQKEGVRMCVPDANASLTIGPLIATGNCSALAGHNGQVWFGIEQYELDSSGTTYWSGMGRLDPSIINDNGAPAWATDVMAAGFAFSPVPQVKDACWDTTGFLHILTDAGVYVRNTTQLVASGYLDSGLISYDLPDDKAARYLTVRTDTTSLGDITPSIAVNGSSTFTNLTVVPAGTLTQRDPISGAAGGYFEIRETLAIDPSDNTKGAVLTRHMLEADPIVISGFFYYVPVLLSEEIQTSDGQKHRMDVAAERAYLEGLRGGGVVVTYTELATVYQVTVEDTQWLPTHINTKRDGMNATMALKLKTV